VEAGFSRQRLLLGVDVTVVVVLELDRWAVAEAAVQPGLVEPVDPSERGELEVVYAPSGAFVADALGLVEPDQRFSQGVDAPIDQVG